MTWIEENDRFTAVHTDDPTAIGQLTITPCEQGWSHGAIIRIGLTAEQRQRFADWTDRTLAQLAETADPDANGWFPSDYIPGQWFMIAHERQLP